MGAYKSAPFLKGRIMSMWPGSGFIPIIIYGGGAASASDSFALLTEDNLNILTENSLDIDIEH